jgi:hypothetical protein
LQRSEDRPTYGFFLLTQCSKKSRARWVYPIPCRALAMKHADEMPAER